MDPKKDGHKGTEVPCPGCGELFWQRLDGRPKSCSRSCARKVSWRGRKRKERVKQSNGYVWLFAPDHASATEKWPYVLEHRFVMEQRLGRPLGKHETVHHLNGDRADNRDENLELWAGRHGKGQRDAHCPTCTCFDP